MHLTETSARLLTVESRYLENYPFRTCTILYSGVQLVIIASPGIIVPMALFLHQPMYFTMAQDYIYCITLHTYVDTLYFDTVLCNIILHIHTWVLYSNVVL